MTDALDARIRRVCAEMMLEVFISSRDKGVEARASEAFHEGVECLQEIAQAPAEAKAGDTGIAPRSDRADMAKPDLGQSSPADPFAPMVEAAVKTWFTGPPNADLRMRRALAAALRAAPCTEAMKAARLDIGLADRDEAWRAYADALAAEIGGGR